MQNPGKMVALIIVFFLGGIGVHKFLTGDYLMGVIYLFTGGICLIGWIIDIIKILKGTYVTKAGEPWGVD